VNLCAIIFKIIIFDIESDRASWPSMVVYWFLQGVSIAARYADVPS